jgi:hypothetical protein
MTAPDPKRSGDSGPFGSAISTSWWMVVGAVMLLIGIKIKETANRLAGMVR